MTCQSWITFFFYTPCIAPIPFAVAIHYPIIGCIFFLISLHHKFYPCGNVEHSRKNLLDVIFFVVCILYLSPSMKDQPDLVGEGEGCSSRFGLGCNCWQIVYLVTGGSYSSNTLDCSLAWQFHSRFTILFLYFFLLSVNCLSKSKTRFNKENAIEEYNLAQKLL